MPAIRRTEAQRTMAKQDIQPSSLHNKLNYERPAPPINARNFPENELQMNKHYTAVVQARYNPADAFR